MHALGNVVSVDVDGGPPPSARREALNTRLPDEISVVSAEEAPADFHARFSARSRTYRYRIFNRRAPSPFERAPLAGGSRAPLDDGAAQRERGARCSASTTSAPSRRPRRSTRSSSAPSSAPSGSARGDHLDFEITANSFLRHMVRTLVGTMLELEPAELAPLLAAGRAREAGTTAPPWGLYLVSVAYDGWLR